MLVVGRRPGAPVVRRRVDLEAVRVRDGGRDLPGQRRLVHQHRGGAQVSRRVDPEQAACPPVDGDVGVDRVPERGELHLRRVGEIPGGSAVDRPRERVLRVRRRIEDGAGIGDGQGRLGGRVPGLGRADDRQRGPRGRLDFGPAAVGHHRPLRVTAGGARVDGECRRRDENGERDRRRNLRTRPTSSPVPHHRVPRVIALRSAHLSVSAGFNPATES